mgnify:CR=1 FL=1
MSDPAYGTMKKKIVFYDSEKRHADLKIRLKADGISQAKFFRSIVTGYLEQDESMLDFVDKIKINNKQSKKGVKASRRLINSGKEAISSLSFDDSEIQSIFDILEREHPEL